MAQVNAGRVRFVSRGEYNNSTQYYLFDLVNYEGSSYVAIANTLGNVPTNTTYWQLIAQKGNVGNTGPVGATGNGIASISKTSTSGLVDTYTITYTDGTTSTYEVTNGEDGEVTQTQFNKLEQRVEDLETNQLMDTVTGTNIDVEDAHETEIVEGKLSKESTQETTMGKNLLSVRTENYDNNGITLTSINNENGLLEYYLLNGTPTSSSAFFILLGQYNGDIETNYRMTGITDYTNIRFRVWKGSSYTDVTSDNTLITTDSTGENYAVQLRIATGVTYNNVKIYPMIRLATIEDTTYEPYTGGIASPNPDYPQEVKTVKGYRNLFDEDNVTFTLGTLDNNGQPTSSTASHYTNEYYDVKPNTNFTISGTLRQSSNQYAIYFYDINKQWISRTDNTSLNPYTFLTPNNCYYIRIQVPKVITLKTHDVMLNEGAENLPYVPYGTNWIYTKVSNGTDTNYYTIPLNDNEIVETGHDKDILIIDKNGHCWLNKKIGKMIFNGTENWGLTDNETAYKLITSHTEFNYIQSEGTSTNSTAGFCNYFIPSYVLSSNDSIGLRFNGASGTIVCREKNMRTVEQFKQLLSTTNMVLYGMLDEPTLIDLQYDVDIRLFNGVNNISNSDDMDMEIKYVQDINTIISNMKNAILEIGGE